MLITLYVCRVTDPKLLPGIVNVMIYDQRAVPQKDVYEEQFRGVV